MALKVNLRHLEAKDLRLTGELPLDELDLGIEDELIEMNQPLSYDLNVERMEKAVLAQGTLKLVLDCECSRCLKPHQETLALMNWAVHLPLEGEDLVEIINDCVDLTPFIRDDILLAFPQHPLCEPECKGLPRPKADAGHAGEREQLSSSSVWSELNKLKL